MELLLALKNSIGFFLQPFLLFSSSSYYFNSSPCELENKPTKLLSASKEARWVFFIGIHSLLTNVLWASNFF